MCAAACLVWNTLIYINRDRISRVHYICSGISAVFVLEALFLLVNTAVLNSKGSKMMGLTVMYIILCTVRITTSALLCLMLASGYSYKLAPICTIWRIGKA